MRKKVWQILLLSVFPLWLALGQPREQDVEKAKKLFNAATVYYNDKDYEKALSGYQDAYNVAALPVILFNMAQCYRFMGRYQEAHDAYQQFLVDDPKTPYRAEVEGKIKDMKEAIAKEEAERARLAEEAKSQPVSAPSSGPLSAPAPDPEPLAKPAWFPYLLPAGLEAVSLGTGSAAWILRSQAKDGQSEKFGQARALAATSDIFLGAALVSGVVTYLVVKSKAEPKTSKPLLQPYTTTGAP